MFPQKELKQLHRRKQTLVARSDLLREEAGQIWSVAGRRAERVERRAQGLHWLPPVLSLLSAGAMIYLKSRPVRGGRCLESLLALVSVAMSSADRQPRGGRTPGAGSGEQPAPPAEERVRVPMAVERE